MSKTPTSKVFGGLDNSLSAEHAKLLTNGSFLKLCTFVPNNDFFSVKESFKTSKNIRIILCNVTSKPMEAFPLRSTI